MVDFLAVHDKRSAQARLLRMSPFVGSHVLRAFHVGRVLGVGEDFAAKLDAAVAPTHPRPAEDVRIQIGKPQVSVALRGGFQGFQALVDFSILHAAVVD